jgi:predicted nucleic acid-binding protein
MSGKSSAVYYFDACVYLAYLQNDEHSYGQNAIQGIDEVWNDNAKGGATIVTSTLTLTEVLSHKLKISTEKLFLRTLQGGLHHLVDVDPPIALLARKYRDYYQAHPIKRPTVPDGKTYTHLTSGDAIHLATAVTFHCDQFWTFDGTGTTAKKSIGLLWLGNKAGEDNLIITTPKVAQGRLL